jgi:hypothetical protein
MRVKNNRVSRKRATFVLEETLRQTRGKSQVVEIAVWVGNHRKRFDRVFGFMQGGDPRLAAPAAWVASHCVELYPGLIDPHFKSMLDLLEKASLSPAVLRNSFRMLQFALIPGSCESRVMSMALAAIGAPVAVAVKACAVTVLKRLSAGYPDLLGEVRLMIMDQLPGASPAFIARARREFGVDARQSGLRMGG